MRLEHYIIKRWIWGPLAGAIQGLITNFKIKSSPLELSRSPEEGGGGGSVIVVGTYCYHCMLYNIVTIDIIINSIAHNVQITHRRVHSQAHVAKIKIMMNKKK